MNQLNFDPKSRPGQSNSTSSTNPFVYDAEPPVAVNPDPSSSDWVLEHYRDIQLPIPRGQGSLIRNLTHPSEIRKRYVVKYSMLQRE